MAGTADFVERFGRQSTAVKALTFLAVLGALGGVYYYLFYGDLLADRDSALNAKKKLIEEERGLLKRKNDYQTLLTRKRDAELRLSRNAVKLPETAELPAFFSLLESQASTANVKLLSRNVEKEIPVENYMKVPVRMVVQGDFYQLNQYFRLLYETPRIISIDSLSIKVKAREADRTVLDATVVASTFRQADRAPPPAPAAPKADKKGANVPLKERADEAGKAAEIK